MAALISKPKLSGRQYSIFVCITPISLKNESTIISVSYKSLAQFFFCEFGVNSLSSISVWFGYSVNNDRKSPNLEIMTNKPGGCENNSHNISTK